MYVIDGSIHKVLLDDLFEVAVEKLNTFSADNRDYNNQIKDYNKNYKHDDTLDALYGGLL